MVASRHSGLYLCLLEQDLGSVFLLGCRLFVLSVFSLPSAHQFLEIELFTCGPGRLLCTWPPSRLGGCAGLHLSQGWASLQRASRAPWRQRCTPASAGSIGPAVYVLSRFSRVRLFATPWAVASQAPLSMGFSRQDYWNGLPCPPPGDLPNPEIEHTSLTSPALAGQVFTTSATWEALVQQDLAPNPTSNILIIKIKITKFFK